MQTNLKIRIYPAILSYHNQHINSVYILFKQDQTHTTLTEIYDFQL